MAKARHGHKGAAVKREQVIAQLEAIYKTVNSELTPEEKDLQFRRYWQQFLLFEQLIARGFAVDFAHYATKVKFLEYLEHKGMTLADLDPAPTKPPREQLDRFVAYMCRDEYGVLDSEEDVLAQPVNPKFLKPEGQ